MRCLMDKVYQQKHVGVMDFVYEASNLIPEPAASSAV
jgi:hypothetical protein